MHFFKAGTAACVLWLILSPAEGLCNNDLKSTELNGKPEIDSEKFARELNENPERLVNYSWRILYSIDENKKPCRDDRCFREGDSIIILNREPASRPDCSADLDLVLADSSNRRMKAYYGINGKINGCPNDASSIEFYFWDPLPGGSRECRRISITPVRMNSDVTEGQCETNLKDLTKLNGQEFSAIFGNSCGSFPLIHWKVTAHEQEEGGSSTPCDGGIVLGTLSPPEPGQGTGSGGGY